MGKINKSKITYDDRIIAFVDIMGFKNLVDDSVNDPYSFEKIRDALDTFRNLKKEKEDPDWDKDVKVTTFSDSLVISYPSNYKGGLFYILLDLIYLQFNFAQLGIIVRGGIAIGKLRHIREEIFGPAMNEAYKLESEAAIYPRIIITENTLLKGIQKTADDTCSLEFSLPAEKEDVMSLVKKDNDGFYYLDFLSQYSEFDYQEDYLQMMATIKAVIIRQLSENASIPKVLEKYEWLKAYYNSVVGVLNNGMLTVIE